MARKGWFDRMLKKFRDEGMPDEMIEKMRDEMSPNLPAEAMAPEKNVEGGSGDVHVHIHPNETDDDEPGAAAAAAAGGSVSQAEFADLQAQVADLASKLAQLMGNDEEDVELEDQDTQDRRRFKLRRGDKIKRTTDEDPPTPEREPEMMGRTDLPGIEDLDGRKTTDSIKLEPIWVETVASAEIIIPGYRMPTFDAAHKPVLTAKRLCALRRGVMCQAANDANTLAIIRRFTADADLKRLPCDSLKIAFNATADAIKTQRDGGLLRTGTDTVVTRDANGNVAPKAAPSLAQMNKDAAAMWNKNTGNGAIRH